MLRVCILNEFSHIAIISYAHQNVSDLETAALLMDSSLIYFDVATDFSYHASVSHIQLG